MMLVDKAEVKKYEFTGETKQVELLLRTVILHRIRAVTDFGMVKAGELGGWIEKEENLSQEGKAWISDEAEVYGNASFAIDCINLGSYSRLCKRRRAYE